MATVVVVAGSAGVVEATVVVVLSGIDGGATVTATMAVVAGAVVGGSVVKATDVPGVSGWVLGPFELPPTTSHNKPAVSTAAPMPSAAVGTELRVESVLTTSATTGAPLSPS